MEREVLRQEAERLILKDKQLIDTDDQL